jgi:hypothetical protein
VDPILAADDDDIEFQLRHCEFTHWPIRNFHRIKNIFTNSDGKRDAFTAYKFGKISVLNNVKSMRIEFWLSKVAQHVSPRRDWCQLTR